MNALVTNRQSEVAVHARRLFDGDRWLDDVTVIAVAGLIEEVRAGRSTGAATIPVVMPGLIDSGVVAEGYLDGPAEGLSPYAPEEAFAGLCRVHGVTSVVDLAAALGPARALVSSGELNVIAALARIGGVPTRRGDITVTPEAAVHVAAALAALGAQVVSLGLWTETPPDLSVGAPWSVVTNRHAGRVPVPGFTVRSALGEIYLAPQALACSLWTVEGMLRAVDATAGRAFLPYLRNFRGAGNFIGRRIARDILTRLYGARTVADLDGWPAAVLDDHASEESPRLLAASGAGAAGVLPGRGLWDELALIEQHRGLDEALRAATSHPADAFPALGAGRIVPGVRCDLLLLDGPATTIAALRASLRGVIAHGEPLNLDMEWNRVRAGWEAADRRSL